MPVILNPAPATELDDKLLSLVSYLIPNEQEASQETHLPLRFDGNGPHDEDLRAIAAALRAKGVEHVIITLGGYGSAVAEASGPRYIPCVRMEHVADPTAAGDSFVGALSTALAVGLTEDEALTFASFTAAITVSRLGAMPALPTLPEVLGSDRRTAAEPALTFPCWMRCADRSGGIFMERLPELQPGRYRHFKGNEYELLYVARHSETLEPMVVYRAHCTGNAVSGCGLPPCGARLWTGTDIMARGSSRYQREFDGNLTVRNKFPKKFIFFEIRGCFLLKAMLLYIS